MTSIEIIISITICLFISLVGVSFAKSTIDKKTSLCGDVVVLLESPKTKATKKFSDSTCEPVLKKKGWLCQQNTNFDIIMAAILDLRILTRQMDTWNKSLELAQSNISSNR